MYAVITGASRGIGKALAYKYGKSGYDLILTCEKNIDLLNEVKSYIEKEYGRKVFVHAGLLTDNDIDSFEKESNTNIKDNIYILINNAGKCDCNTIDKISDIKYKDMIDSNINYTFFTTKLISKYLLKRKDGIIINITSMWGILGSSCEVVYSMVKGAIIVFTKALAKEFLSSGVSVIGFALGAVDTDMIDQFLSKEDKDDFAKTLTDGKLFTTSEIAKKIYDTISTGKAKSGEIVEINNGLK